MESIVIREATESDRQAVVELSQQWAAENRTYGYTAETLQTLRPCRICCAVRAGGVVGFLFGQRKISEGMCVIPRDSLYFDVTGVYVRPECRGRGIGRAIFDYVEQSLRREHLHYLLLSMAEREPGKIRKYYAEKIGTTVWTTTFYKTCEGDASE